MMWRGTAYSSLLHGGILAAVLFGIPVLPEIFDRNREIETEFAEQSISVEIVSTASVDLRQNVVAPENRTDTEPMPATTTGALRPLVIGETDPRQTEETPPPSARADKTRIPEGALKQPQSGQTIRSRIQNQARRQTVRKREAQGAQPAKLGRRATVVGQMSPDPPTSETDPPPDSAAPSNLSPTLASDAVKSLPAKKQSAAAAAKEQTAAAAAKEQTAAATAKKQTAAATAKEQTAAATAKEQTAAATAKKQTVAATAKEQTAAATAKKQTAAIAAAPNISAPETGTPGPAAATERTVEDTAPAERRTGSRASAGGNRFLEAVRGRKRDLVMQVLESDNRLQQAVTPRPESVEVPEQARTRTLKRLRKSAASGFPHAQYNLAGIYLRGDDLPSDPMKALNWLTRAAQQGYLPAQTLLGLLRFTGLGVPQDQAEAAFWWSLAADGGDDGAKIGAELIQRFLKPRELVKSKRLRARWGSLINDLADLTAGDTNRRDLDNELRMASERGDFDAVLSLLASGADADEAGDEGRNAVINAAWRGRERIMQLLLERGVATELPDDGGRTPLIWAAINGHGKIIRRLVESGANPNHTDRDGGTALIRAAWNGHASVVRSLIAAGADVTVRDGNGLTALAHARREGNSTIVNALSGAGAR